MRNLTQIGFITSLTVHASASITKLIKLDDNHLAVGHDNGDIEIVYLSSSSDDLTLTLKHSFVQRNGGHNR